MTTSIRFDDLTLGYERHPAVHHLHGEIRPGSLLAVVGPNGGGKSTLMKGIMGMLRPQHGKVVMSGGARRDIAYLPQLAQLDRQFPLTVIDLVAMGLWRRLGLFGGIGAADRGKVHEALSSVGLGGFELRGIGTLSGGQFQRVLFARLLLQDAKVILLDEPFTAIDAKTAADLLDLIHRWHGEQRTIVTVLHDLDAVRTHFPDTLLLAREAIAWGPTSQVLTGTHLLRSRELAEAWDELAQPCAHRRAGDRRARAA